MRSIRIFSLKTFDILHKWKSNNIILYDSGSLKWVEKTLYAKDVLYTLTIKCKFIVLESNNLSKHYIGTFI